MLKASGIFLLVLVVPAVAAAQRNLHFTGDFESGKILPYASAIDGFYFHTLPHPQTGSESVAGSKGGLGPASQVDTRVVYGDVVGTEIVPPRKGNFFLRSALYYDKDYSELNEGGKQKPRSKIYMSHENQRFDFDVEGYLAFSIYLPENFEHETGVTDSRGTIQLYQGVAEGASWITWVLRIYVPGGDIAHWMPYVNVNAKSVKGEGQTEYDLGPVTDDLGKWTDFIVRYRFNPFSVATNPARSGIPDSKDQLYEGNKGIFQMWKSVGKVDSEGNREMMQVINMENEPVGNVPHATEKIAHLFRIYKYGWHKNETDVKGPVWIGFDEIRDGRILEDGTRYRDVHPGQLMCTDNCPDQSDERLPMFPTGVGIVR